MYVARTKCGSQTLRHLFSGALKEKSQPMVYYSNNIILIESSRQKMAVVWMTYNTNLCCRLQNNPMNKLVCQLHEVSVFLCPKTFRKSSLKWIILTRTKKDIHCFIGSLGLGEYLGWTHILNDINSYQLWIRSKTREGSPPFPSSLLPALHLTKTVRIKQLSEIKFSDITYKPFLCVMPRMVKWDIFILLVHLIDILKQYYIFSH